MYRGSGVQVFLLLSLRGLSFGFRGLALHGELSLGCTDKPGSH